MANKKKKTRSYKRISKQKSNIILVLVAIIIVLVLYIIIHFSTFNHNKDKVNNVISKNNVFLGDSITELYNLNKYYDNYVVNSGISGNVTEDILNDLNNRVYRYNPSKVFLLIGTNDIERGISEDKIVSNIEEIINSIKKNRPYSKIYVQSIYPVDEYRYASDKRSNKEIKSINNKLKEYCDSNNIKYIDLYGKLIDDSNNLKDSYSRDGLHLTEEGYRVVTDNLKKYLD